MMEIMQEGEIAGEYPTGFAELVQSMRQIKNLLAGGKDQVDLPRMNRL